MSDAQKQYKRRLIITMIAYMVLLIGSITLLDSVREPSLIYVLAILPLVPVIYGIVAFMRYLRAMDELQQKIQLEAFGFSLGCTGILTFSLGLLENAGIPRLSLVWVLPLMIIFWGIGQAFVTRRYR